MTIDIYHELSGEMIPEREEGIFKVDVDASLLLGSSAHGAQIVVDSDERRWIRKSSYSSLEKAHNEIDMLSLFQKNGIPTLPIVKKMEPFVEEIEGDPNTKARVYLPQIRGLRLLTGLDWAKIKGTEEFDELTSVLHRAIELASVMHMRGFSHGDFQLKNIGEIRSGEMIVYDLENSKSLNGLSSEAKNNLKVSDLVSLIKSARVNGLLAVEPRITVARELGDALQQYALHCDDDDSIEIVAEAEAKLIDWITDPYRVSRATARFMFSRLKDKS